MLEPARTTPQWRALSAHLCSLPFKGNPPWPNGDSCEHVCTRTCACMCVQRSLVTSSEYVLLLLLWRIKSFSDILTDENNLKWSLSSRA